MKLREYLIKRSIQIVITLIVVLVLLFIIFRMMPGNPASMMMDPRMKPEQMERIKQLYGLDKPMWEQFILYMKNMLTGDLGISFQYQRPVIEIISEKIGPTLLLFGSALVIAYILGILLGAIMAWRRGSKGEITGIVVSLFFYSMPLFWFGQIMLWLFAFQIPIFPLGGMGGYAPDGTPYHGLKYVVDVLYHLALPLITLTIAGLAGNILLMRNSMLDTLAEDYIVTARAKGIPERRIMYRHAARNAMLPVLTSFAMGLGFIVSGGVLTEYIFSWPGMGTVMVNATFAHDYPMIQGVFYIIAILVLVFNAIADVLYAYLDPRVRL